VILWRRLAEIVERYVHKGDKLYIEGRLRYSTYDNKQGQRQYVTEIWADNMEMLSAKPVGQQEQSAANQTTATEATTESSQSDALPF
jgi:single-strand DNA-binding protein